MVLSMLMATLRGREETGKFAVNRGKIGRAFSPRELFRDIYLGRWPRLV